MKEKKQIKENQIEEHLAEAEGKDVPNVFLRKFTAGNHAEYIEGTITDRRVMQNRKTKEKGTQVRVHWGEVFGWYWLENVFVEVEKPEEPEA